MLRLNNGINVNMRHKWRREYLASEVGTRETAPSIFMEDDSTTATNLVVSVAASLPLPVGPIAPKATCEPCQTIQSGLIEISLATTTLRLEGPDDAVMPDAGITSPPR
ncbi:MAG: hypothetical protein ACI9ZF_002393 [Bradyrhizobium sp.]